MVKSHQFTMLINKKQFLKITNSYFASRDCCLNKRLDAKIFCAEFVGFEFVHYKTSSTNAWLRILVKCWRASRSMQPLILEKAVTTNLALSKRECSPIKLGPLIWGESENFTTQLYPTNTAHYKKFQIIFKISRLKCECIK